MIPGGRSVALAGAAGAREGRPGLEDLFPGRWDRRRSLHPDILPLVEALGAAMEIAGWWRPRSGAAVDAALVLGTDVQAAESAALFAKAAQGGEGSPAAPGDFLFALPSSAAALAGILFGFERFQAALTLHGLSGIGAVALGLDLLRRGRTDRVAVGALSVVGPATAPIFSTGGPAQIEPPAGGRFRLGVAWCLDLSGEPPLAHVEAAEVAWPCEAAVAEPGQANERRTALESAALLDDLPSAFRTLGAPGLLAATRALGSPGSGSIQVFHRDPLLGGVGRIRLALERARSGRAGPP